MENCTCLSSSCHEYSIGVIDAVAFSSSQVSEILLQSVQTSDGRVDIIVFLFVRRLGGVMR